MHLVLNILCPENYDFHFNFFVSFHELHSKAKAYFRCTVICIVGNCVFFMGEWSIVNLKPEKIIFYQMECFANKLQPQILYATNMFMK